MPSLHEILAAAPSVRNSEVSSEKLKTDWETLKEYKITTSGAGRIQIDSHVLACLLSGSRVRGYLMSASDISAFDNIVQRAKAKLAELNVVNPKIKAMHDGCRTAAGDY